MNARNARTEKLAGIISIIPENTTEEALMAIQTIVTYPFEMKIRINVFLAHKFVLWVKVDRIGDSVTIESEGFKPLSCTKATFIAALKRYIYDTDEAIGNGHYKPGRPVSLLPLNIIRNSQPPAYMDIPIWDDVRKCWYDAEV